MNFRLSLLLPFSLILIGCQGDLTFINHPRPEVTVDFSPFEDAGCPPNEYGARYCEQDSPLGALGCDEIRKPSDLLGGLQPTYSIARCYIEPFLNQGDLGDAEFPEDGTFFYNVGGLYPRFVRYVVFKDGGFELVHNQEELQALYAPIETEAEALAYALAVNQASAYFDLELDPELKYLVDKIEDTHVDQVDEGFRVHLFHYQFFGCGPHETYALTYQVTTSGEIEEINADPIYKDPADDDLCVD